jgi:hypothetical protein
VERKPEQTSPHKATCFLVVACGSKLGQVWNWKMEKQFRFFSSNIHTRGCYSLISCLSKKLLSKFAYLHFYKRSSLFKTRMVRKRFHFFLNLTNW